MHPRQTNFTTNNSFSASKHPILKLMEDQYLRKGFLDAYRFRSASPLGSRLLKVKPCRMSLYSSRLTINSWYQMMLKTGVAENFLKLFYHEIVDHPIGNSNKLNLFILKIESNRFTYQALTNELYDLIITFALSRTELERLKDSTGGKKFKLACEKLRNHLSNEGELGELLLYCFLESHLKAPKILTKLEIKTAANNYVNGADGVHLLKTSDNTFQLVFGESKLHADLKTGIDHAFKSILEFIDSEKNKIGYETNLLTGQLLKESVDDATYQFLRSIIVPTEQDTNLELDHSFGIFLGYDHVCTDEEMKMENSAFRDHTKGKVSGLVKEVVNKLETKINNTNLAGYSFHVYVMPFTELEKIRKEIIEKIVT